MRNFKILIASALTLVVTASVGPSTAQAVPCNTYDFPTNRSVAVKWCLAESLTGPVTADVNWRVIRNRNGVRKQIAQVSQTKTFDEQTQFAATSRIPKVNCEQHRDRYRIFGSVTWRNPNDGLVIAQDPLKMTGAGC